MNLHKRNFTKLIADGLTSGIIREVTADLGPTFGHSVIFEGRTTSVSYSRIPNEFVIHYGGVTIKFAGIVVKKSKNAPNAQVRKIARPTTHYAVESSSMVGEGFASMLLSELFTNGISPHFVVSFGFTESLLFMEYCGDQDGTVNLSEFAVKRYFTDKQMPTAEIDAIVIAILHTLMLGWERYRFIDTDLHDGNLLFVPFKNTDPYYQGKNGAAIKYVQYILDNPNAESDTILYVQNYGYIVKIIDYGVGSISYGKTTLINGYGYHDTWESLSKKYCFVNTLVIRALINYFGLCNSDILADLLANVPVISTIPLVTHYDIACGPLYKGSMTPREILARKSFAKYLVAPQDITFDNSIVVGEIAICAKGHLAIKKKLLSAIHDYNLPIICKKVCIKGAKTSHLPEITLAANAKFDIVLRDFIICQMKWLAINVSKQAYFAQLSRDFAKNFPGVDLMAAIESVNVFQLSKRMGKENDLVFERNISRSWVQIITFLQERGGILLG